MTVAGAAAPAVVGDPDRVVEAYSVNKIAVAVAVLDKVDRGLLALDQRVDVTALAKGFRNTRVEPVANPNRFFLGTSTARETHALLTVLFSDRAPDPDNFGATHPAVAARAAMGRDFLDAADRLAGDPAVPPTRSRAYRPSNGG